MRTLNKNKRKVYVSIRSIDSDNNISYTTPTEIYIGLKPVKNTEKLVALGLLDIDTKEFTYFKDEIPIVFNKEDVLWIYNTPNENEDNFDYKVISNKESLNTYSVVIAKNG